MDLQLLVKSRQILTKFTTYDIPSQDAWDLKVFIKKLEPEFKAYDEEEAKLIKKFGKETKDGIWEVKVSDTVQFSKYIEAITPLWEKKIKVKPPQIDHKPLMKDKKLKIPAQIFIVLDWLFV